MKEAQLFRVLSLGAVVSAWLSHIPVGQASESHLSGSHIQNSPSASRPDDSLIYRIGPGDTIAVLVWKEADFSGNFQVRFDGRVTLPLVGDVTAAGKTPPELSAEMQQQLRRFLEVPQVTVTVAEANSARYYVIGKVNNQGAFPYIGPMRVVQALAIAGGFQEFAQRSRIFVIREVDGRLTYLPVNYETIENDRSLGGNISLLSGDTIVVP